MDLEELDEFLDDHPQETISDKIVHRPFGYHGSKHRSIPFLLEKLPYSEIFVDVFGGSGIVILNRRPSKKLDVYNDRWSGVVNFYRVIRNPLKRDQMIEYLKLTIPSKETFYECKDWEAGTTDVEQAARWYYMIQCSYANLGRNWGYSRKTMISNNYLKQLEHLAHITTRFQNIQVDNEDFRDIFERYDSAGTVFYCDPPYVNSEQAGSYAHKLSEADHYDLIDCAKRAHGYVAISHRPNELYDREGWDDIETWEIAGSNHGAQTVSNHRIGKDTNVIRTEKLYIKDFK